MLSSPDGQSMFANVSEAAQSIRQLAATLDTRLDQISADVSRFTGPGLRQVEALIDQGRRTLQRVDRVFADLERNPSGLLFGGGGSGIPEYRGSRR
jgi:phospholipid/cholesterol/gamma-HCH transport system substrate-binding protein